ncbi:MAG: N-6 DNA methylase, partial [Ilumatobacteraceae bacterium]
MPQPQTSWPAPGHATGRDRKALGAWSTPADLVELVVTRTIEAAWLARFDRPMRVLDPACGDGRFLVAAATRIVELGGRVELTGVDVDPTAVAATTVALAGVAPEADVDVRCADSLHEPPGAWNDEHYDVVVGNPPFLSQLAAGSTRGGSSRHGGGPYADAAAEFLALAVRLTRPGGRVGMVLPQSVLAARDVG